MVTTWPGRETCWRIVTFGCSTVTPAESAPIHSLGSSAMMGPGGNRGCTSMVTVAALESAVPSLFALKVNASGPL